MGKAIVVLLAVWLVVIVLMTGPLFYSSDSDQHITRRLTKAMNELELLKRQNDELRTLLADFRVVNENGDKARDQLMIDLRSKLSESSQMVEKRAAAVSSPVQNVCEPSLEFELTRRNVIRGVTELWYFLGSELKSLKSSVPDDPLKKKIQSVLDLGSDFKRSVLHDLHNLSTMDGLQEWRIAEERDLSNLIQTRLHYLQNPKDCSSAKKITCNLNKGCGYGCQIHHVVYCLILAYGTERTLILNSKGWRYNREGWEAVFKPVSETCRSAHGKTQSVWPGTPNTQVLNLPIIDSISPRPRFLPLAIPADISVRLRRVHGDPIVWWVGQFLKYLLRPQDSLKRAINETTAKLGFQKPIVGIHVRRTDKVGTEAAFHHINEYMKQVESFYRQLEMVQPVPVRRVYVASDDSSVLEEAKKKFPDYVFIGDPSISRTASVATRYSDASLRGIIMDIHFLAMTDYLVCTFSSQVCRMAYEIMQSVNPDASNQFCSLDDIYYFGGQNAHNHEALYAHQPINAGEIGLQPGDLLGIAGNHWNGFSKGVNRRTRQQGVYPSFKAINKVDVVNFPTYPEVDKLLHSSPND